MNDFLQLAFQKLLEKQPAVSAKEAKVSVVKRAAKAVTKVVKKVVKKKK